MNDIQIEGRGENEKGQVAKGILQEAERKGRAFVGGLAGSIVSEWRGKHD